MGGSSEVGYTECEERSCPNLLISTALMLPRRVYQQCILHVNMPLARNGLPAGIFPKTLNIPDDAVRYDLSSASVVSLCLSLILCSSVKLPHTTFRDDHACHRDLVCISKQNIVHKRTSLTGQTTTAALAWFHSHRGRVTKLWTRYHPVSSPSR